MNRPRVCSFFVPITLSPSPVKKTGGMVFQVVENSKKRLARPS